MARIALFSRGVGVGGDHPTPQKKWPTFLLFLVRFHFALWGRFLAIFPIFLGFVGILWGTPANYFADFGAILAIFDHFWAIFFCRF